MMKTNLQEGKEERDKKVKKRKIENEQKQLDGLFQELKEPYKNGDGHIVNRALVKYLFTRFFRWVNYMSKASLILIVVLSTVLSIMIFKRDILFSENEKKYRYDGATGIVRKMQKLKKSHSYWVNISKDEIYHEWVDMMVEVKYKKNGAMKFREADCASAVHTFLEKYGYARNILNVKALNKSIDELASVKYLKIRSKISEVRTGDLIIFNPIRSNWHVGIVVDTVDGQIIYADMNGLYGMGFRNVKWSNRKKIKKIAEVSYPFWAGSVWDEYQKDPIAGIEHPETEEDTKK